MAWRAATLTALTLALGAVQLATAFRTKSTDEALFEERAEESAQPPPRFVPTGRRQALPRVTPGGQAVLDMIRGMDEQMRYLPSSAHKGRTLHFEGVTGPEKESNGVSYYSVKLRVAPSLAWARETRDWLGRAQPSSGECPYAVVKMRYSDFERLWADYREPDKEGSDEFPGTHGVLGRLQGFWSTITFKGDKVEEELRQRGEERRQFFDELLQAVFKIEGNADGVVEVARSPLFFHSMYSSDHISAMIIDKVFGLYECLTE